MALNKSTKYAIANLGFAVLVYLVARFFFDVMAQPRDGSKAGEYIVLGVVLYVVASVVIVMRAYFRRSRLQVVDQSERGSELHAHELLAAGRLKKIKLRILVEPKEYDALETAGHLVLAPERFNMPIRHHDTVQVCSGTGNYQRCINASITDIDGYNQQVTLAPSKMP